MRKIINKNILILISAMLCLGSASLFAIFFSPVKVSALENDYIETTATVADNYFCLRDTDLFLTKDQQSLGLCWDFASTTAFENFLGRKTNQLYDFSETWISIIKHISNSNYNIGGGGKYFDFVRESKKYGLLFEEDLPYDVAYNVDATNASEIYNKYKDLAFKSYTNNALYKMYNTDEVQKVKLYLLENGALTISYDSYYMMTSPDIPYSYSHCPTTNNDNKMLHEITLIGWDDNITFNDKYGYARTGAWICLNSWGTATKDEIVYISYKDKYGLAAVGGIQTTLDFNYKITNSNSNIENRDIKRYKNGWNETTTGSYKQKNIFYYGQNIDLEYTYEYSGDINIDVVIEKGGKDVSSLFSNISVNKSSKKIVIEAGNNLDSGTYKVIFNLDKDGDGKVDEQWPNQLFIFSGAETSSIVNNYIYQGSNGTYSTEKENTIYALTYDNADYGVIQFHFGTLSTVNNVELQGPNLSIRSSSYQLADASNYAYGKVSIRLTNIKDYKKCNSKVIFNTVGGSKVTFKLEIYKVTKSDIKTYIFYDLDSEEHDNPKYIVLGRNYAESILTSIPTKNGYEFAGWYLDKALTNPLTKNSSGYVILNSYKKSPNYSSNYNDNNSSYFRAYIFLYPKWTVANFKFDGGMLPNCTYGDNLNIKINPAINGKGSYTYTVLSPLPMGLEFIYTVDKLFLRGDILTTGNFEILITVKDNATNQEITATFTLHVNKRNITYKIDDKQSAYGDPLIDFTGSVVSGSIYGSDELNIVLDSDVRNDSPIGNYEIVGTWNNSNYLVTFINGTYKITKQLIKASVQNYVGTYDGNMHSIYINIDQTINPTIQYSYNRDTDYSNQKIAIKNYTPTPVQVFIKISADGYENLVLSGIINISKRDIRLTWRNTDLTYNGNVQKPTCDVSSGKVASDELDIIVNGSNINAGDYTATAYVENENYNIVNNTYNYTIKKADPIINLKSIKLNNEEIEKASKLSEINLPQHFVWNYPDKEVKIGDNIAYLTYSPTDTLNYNTIDSIEVKFTKPNPQDKLIALIIGVIIIGIAISLITLIVIKSTKTVREKQSARPVKTKKQSLQKDEVLIIFVTNAPISLAPIKVNARETIKLPVLERNYYEFAGWYTDNLCLKPYTTNGVEKKLVLYAKWRPKI